MLILSPAEGSIAAHSRLGRLRAPCVETSARLFNFDPPATDEEVRAASVQFVRKLSGFTAPSKANQQAFDLAIGRGGGVARRLIDSLTTNAEPRLREIEAAKAKARSAARFGTTS